MRKKLVRVTTADISLLGLLGGQLGFLNREFEVVGLAADTGCLDTVARNEGIRVIDVPMRRDISLWSDLRSLFTMIRVLRKERPFIVHSNTPKGSLLSMVAGKLVGVPNRLYTVTGLRYQGESGTKRKLLMLMERITCFCATRVIPEGEGVKKTLRADRITGKPLNVIHNGNISGIDTSFFSPAAVGKTRKELREELGFEDDDFVFVFVGRIVKDKGMNELADAMRCLKRTDSRCKLLLVGPFESDLDSLAEGNEEFFRTDESIKYVGFQSDVRPFLLAADALVFPSYREGFPNVVMQAGAMGLPSIVTDINGCNEIIQEGLNGRIIPPRDEAALESVMRWFMDNPEAVSSMAAHARYMIQSRYEREDVWNALLEMYRSLS